MKYVALLFVAVLVAMPVFADSSPDGAAIYKSKCAMCHGPDGAGQTPMGKNLKLKALGSAEVQATSDGDLGKIIADGKGKMPAYKTKVTAAEIQALVGFIRTLKK